MNNKVIGVLIALVVLIGLMLVLISVKNDFSITSNTVKNDVEAGVQEASYESKIVETSGIYEYEDSCSEKVEQEKIDKCYNYVNQNNGKCYRIVKVGCDEKKIEVSCFDEVEQFKIEKCDEDVEQMEKKCYIKEGCNERPREVDCFKFPEQKITDVPCDKIDQIDTCNEKKILRCV